MTMTMTLKHDFDQRRIFPDEEAKVKRVFLSAQIFGLLITSMFAQNRPVGGENAARKLIADYAAAENKHDVQGMAALFRDDAVFRTVQGFLTKGRTEIEKNLAGSYSGVFKNSHATFEVMEVTPIRPDVIMVDAVMERLGVQAPDGTPIPGQRKSLVNFVLTQEPEGWRIASYRNNVVISFVPGGPTVLGPAPGPPTATKR
jgi:uncharacterized protein (TIGR02246 family)